MNGIFFISGVILAIVSIFIFYKYSWKALIVFIPLTILPVIWVECAQFLSLFIIPITMGPAGIISFKKERGINYILTVSTISFAMIFTAQYHVIKEFKDFDILKVASNNTLTLMEKSDSELEDISKEYNISAENKEKIREDLKNYKLMLQDNKWLQLARDMLPFISFIYALSIAGVSFFLTRRIFFRKVKEEIPALEFFEIKEYLIFAFIAGWGGFLLFENTSFLAITMISLNIALIMSTLYLFQALGVIIFHLQIRGIPVILLPLTIIIVLILGSSAVMFTMILLIGIGTLDLWADFRKISIN